MKQIKRPEREPDFQLKSYRFWFDESIYDYNKELGPWKIDYSTDLNNVFFVYDSFKLLSKSYKEWLFNKEMKKLLSED